MPRCIAFLLFVGLLAQAAPAPDYEVITPENPYPDLPAPRKFWPTLREHFLAAPLDVDQFGWVRRYKVGASEHLQLQASFLQRSADPATRSRTVTLLGRCLNRHAAPILVDQIARESDPRVAADALRALGRVDGANKVADFAGLLAHSDALVRFEAVRLYALSDSLNIEQIRARIGLEDDPRIRNALLGILADHADSRIDDWREIVNHPHVRTAQIAIRGLLSIPGADPQQVLGLCEHRNPALRMAVITNLRGDAPFADAVLEKLLSDPTSGIRSSCATFIGANPTPTRETQLQTLTKDATGNVREEAARALAKFATQTSIDTLFALTADPLSTVRHAAETSLLAQPDTATIDRLAGEHLAQDSEDHRYHACRLLVGLESRQHINALAPLLDSEARPKNRATVIDALVTAGAAAHADKLGSFVVQQPPIVQSAAARSIVAFDTRSAFEHLRKLSMADETDQYVREDVVEAMGRLGHGDEFSDTLLAVLKATDPEKFVAPGARAYATWATSRLNNPSKPLLKRLTTQIISKVVPIPGNPPDFDDEQVRIGACWALVHLAKRDIEGSAKSAKRMIDILTSPLDSPTASDMALTHRMRNYAYQAQQYWDEAAVTLEDVPTYPFRFDFRENKSALTDLP